MCACTSLADAGLSSMAWVSQHQPPPRPARTLSSVLLTRVWPIGLFPRRLSQSLVFHRKDWGEVGGVVNGKAVESNPTVRICLSIQEPDGGTAVQCHHLQSMPTVGSVHTGLQIPSDSGHAQLCGLALPSQGAHHETETYFLSS